MNEINWNDERCFKTWNYKFLHENASAVIIDAVAVLLGDYAAYRKQAAMLLLKALLTKDFLKFLLEDSVGIYPFDRNDFRVRKWKAEVLAKGYCEFCGAIDDLEAHHIVKWSEFPMGRIDVKNGACLCHKCHTNEHAADNCYYMMKAKCY